MRRFCVLGGAAVETKLFVREFPERDSQCYIERLYNNLGGCGLHTATFLSRLGVEVRIVTQIGNDEGGDLIESTLTDAGVDSSYVLRSSNTSAFHSIFDRELKRMMFIKATDWNCEKLLLYLEDALNNSEILILCPTTLNLFISALKIARKLGKIIVTLPQASLFRQPSEVIEDIFSYSNYIFLNEKEFLTYRNMQDYLKAKNDLQLKSDQLLVVTMGDKGCEVLSNKKNIKQHALHGEIVDPTGAGDSLMAGFMWAIENGYNLKKAAYVGTLAGSTACRLPALIEEGFPVDEFIWAAETYTSV